MDPALEDDSSRPSPGLDLSSLEVFEELGRGAFGTCWRAKYQGQPVALKVMSRRPKLSAPPGPLDAPKGPSEQDLYERMFLREAQVTKQLEHRHIVRCIGVAQLPAGTVPNQSVPALAMILELCKPYTLKGTITRGMAAGKRGYPVRQAYMWLLQVAAALAHLHRQVPSIIHRDVKPENILLKRDDGGELICKLSDLGLHVKVSEDRSVMLRRKSTKLDPSSNPGPGSRTGGRSAGCLLGAAAAVRRPVRESAPPLGGGGAGGGGGDNAIRNRGGGAGGRGAAPHVACAPLDRATFGSSFKGCEWSPFLTISAVFSFSTVNTAAARTAAGSRKELCPSTGRIATAQQSPHVAVMRDADCSVTATVSARNGSYATTKAHTAATSRPSGSEQALAAAPHDQQLLGNQGCRTAVRQQLAQARPESDDELLLPLPPVQLRKELRQLPPLQLLPHLPTATSPFAAATEQQQAALLDTSKTLEEGPDVALSPKASVAASSTAIVHCETLHRRVPLAPAWSAGSHEPRGCGGLRVVHRARSQPDLTVPPTTEGVAKLPASGSAGAHGQGSQHQQRMGSMTPPLTSPHSPRSPMMFAAPSATLSAILTRHPGMVKAVAPSNPAAGLRQVGSLRRQLGNTELQPLRRHEMEWVYGLTGNAGSYMYMAPEVFRNEPYNEKSDVFSFGVLAYELLAGDMLVISIFNTVRASQLQVRDPQGYAARVAEGYRPARTQALSDAAWALLSSCWHQDPVQRPTMAHVEEQLAKLLEGMEGGGRGDGGSGDGGRGGQQPAGRQAASSGAAAGRGRRARQASRVVVGSAPPPCCAHCCIIS